MPLDFYLTTLDGKATSQRVLRERVEIEDDNHYYFIEEGDGIRVGIRHVLSPYVQSPALEMTARVFHPQWGQNTAKHPVPPGNGVPAYPDVTDPPVDPPVDPPGETPVPFTPFVNFPTGRSTTRNRNPATIAWGEKITITQTAINAGMWGPIVTLSDGKPGIRITDRNLRTLIPGENAVLIKGNLTVAVEFARCTTFSYGMPGYLKSGNFGTEANVDLRLYDHIGMSGRPPAGYDGASPARFMKADHMKNFVMDGFEWYGCGGIYFDGWNGNSTNVCHIRNGGAYNCDGRRVDAAGNWRTSSILAEYFDTNQFAQINNAFYVENVVWEKFEVINDPLYGAMFEDALSAHNSGGTVASNILWQDYLIENCLPYDGGVFAASNGTNPRYGRGPDNAIRGHSGTGGLAGDGGTNSGLTTARRFTILTSYNAYTGISAGGRSTMRDFIAYGVGAFRSAATVGYTLMEKQFTGLQLIDYASGYNPAQWYGHVIANAQIGVFTPQPSGVLNTNTNTSGGDATKIGAKWVNGSYLMVSNGPSTQITGLNDVIAMANPGTVTAGLARIDQLRAERRADIAARGGVLGVRA